MATTPPAEAEERADAADDAARLRARALRLLARRDHGRDELRRKLLAPPRPPRRAPTVGRGAEPPKPTESSAPSSEAIDPRELAAARAGRVDALLDDLQRLGWLSDARCVEVFAHAAAARLGGTRIEQALGRRGLSLGLLDDERRDELKASEPARAQALLRRRWGDAPPADAAEALRRWRFLVARGFAPDLVRRLVRAGRTDRGDGAD